MTDPHAEERVPQSPEPPEASGEPVEAQGGAGVSNDGRPTGSEAEGTASRPEEAVRGAETAAERGAQGVQEISASEQIAQLQAEIDELKNRMLRLAADYQNYVRRSQQHIAEARRQQLVEAVRALLPVLDHFDRALEVDPATATAQSVLEGMRIVHEELIKVLEQLGVRRIVAQVGEVFDPARHEALMQQEREDLAPGHVAAALQPGYVLGEITIRPAKVAVTPAREE